MIASHWPIRLTVVQTHPVQYYAPWFRHIAAHCPELDLTVLYATAPTAAQQGVGFGVSFQWDTPLVEGYRCRILRAARQDQSVHSERFWGLDVPQIGAALEASRFHFAFDASVGGVLGREEAVDRFAQHLFAAPSQHPARTFVPDGDVPFKVGAHNRIVNSALHDLPIVFGRRVRGAGLLGLHGIHTMAQGYLD